MLSLMYIKRGIFLFNSLSIMKKILVLIVLCVMQLATVHAQMKEQNTSAIDEAWNYIGSSHYDKAEKILMAATAENNEVALRAHLSLMYLYSFQRRYSESEQQYEACISLSKNPYPYYYAGLFKNFSHNITSNDNNAFMRLLEKMKNDKNAPGIIRASSSELLGQFLTKKGDISAAQALYESIGAITTWALIGPFDNAGGSGFDTEYAPEKQYEPEKEYAALNGITAKWFSPPMQRRDKWIDFERFFPYQDAVFYAITFVYSDNDAALQVRTGTSGAIKTWWNDNLIISESEETNNDLDTYIAPVQVKKGWNKLFVKVCNSELERVNFFVRMTDDKGNPVEGLRYSKDKQQYTPSPSQPLSVIENEFEVYLRNYVQKNPKHIEHCLLLADSYLRNERSEKAEITLRDALQYAPKSPLVLEAMLEVYARSKKYDEVTTTLETISTIDSTIPMAIDYRFREYLKQEQFDKADYLLDIVKKQSPSSERYYSFALDLAVARKSEQILPLMKEAFNLFPTSLRFATIYATYLSEGLQDKEGAISVLERVLAINYSSEVLALIAAIQLKDAPSLTKGIATLEKVVELDPASPGIYMQIGKLYASREQYRLALKELEKSLEFCPTCGKIYEQIGETYKNLQEKEQALTHYKKALQLYPFDFDLRTTIRDLEGKKPLFSTLPMYNVDSLISAAPQRNAYPTDPVLIVLDDDVTVIHPEGGYETLRTLVVKILNKQGIDNYKEMQLSGYIEKAIVMKPNGTQVKADISDDGDVVFKTLEENDIVFVKWRSQYIESGYFLHHYYNTAFFETRYPVILSRYALVTPDNRPMTITTQSMTNTPEKRTTELGVMNSWVLQNIPAIKFETGMPSWEEIGKWVKISTIPSWKDFSSWYGKITKSKLKTSYEIKEKTAEVLGTAPLTEDQKIKKIYEFITSQIRYSSVPFRQNGWVPQKARDVLITKIGDCKDVATLGIAMLNEAGIKADYVLVNTDIKALQIQLPSPVFDHCIAAIHTKSGKKYLDFTAHHFAVTSIPSSDLDVMCLEINTDNSGALFSLKRENFDKTKSDVYSKVRIDDNNMLSLEQRSSFTGTMAASYRSAFVDEGYDDVKKMVGEWLGSSYPGVEIDTVWTTDTENRDIPFEHNVHFSVPNFINESGSYRMLRIPWVFSLDPDESVSYKERKYPLEYYYTSDITHEKVEISLPPSIEPYEMTPVTTFSCPIADYEVKRTFSNGVLVLERTYTIKKRSATVAEYQAIKEFINNVVREDDKRMLLGEAKKEVKTPGKKGKK